jgi:hypothetical protein
MDIQKTIMTAEDAMQTARLGEASRLQMEAAKADMTLQQQAATAEMQIQQMESAKRQSIMQGDLAAAGVYAGAAQSASQSSQQNLQQGFNQLSAGYETYSTSQNVPPPTGG